MARFSRGSCLRRHASRRSRRVSRCSTRWPMRSGHVRAQRVSSPRFGTTRSMSSTGSGRSCTPCSRPVQRLHSPLGSRLTDLAVPARSAEAARPHPSRRRLNSQRPAASRDLTGGGCRGRVRTPRCFQEPIAAVAVARMPRRASDQVTFTGQDGSCRGLMSDSLARRILCVVAQLR